MKIGEIIRARRNELGYSQDYLGRLYGTNDADISRIEHGKEISINDLIKLAELLKLNLLDVLIQAEYIQSSRPQLVTQEEFEYLSSTDIIYIRTLVEALVNKRKDAEQQ